MKKTGLFISVMVVAIVWVSCSNEFAETRGEEQSVVGFSTPLTRGSSIDCAEDVANAGGFSVWAYKHTGPWTSAVDKTILIDNVGVGYGRVTSTDGNTWDYGTPQYWPIVQKVSFFACAPHGYASWDGTLDTDEIPVITCTVPTSIGDQKDFMIADQVYNATGPSPVLENFHHALSRITFSALKADLMPGDVKITAIELTNIYSSGNAQLKTPVLWSLDSDLKNYKLAVSDGLLDVVLGSETAKNITADDGIMFLMPQEFHVGAKLTVHFTSAGLNLSWTGAIPGPTEWLPGRAYNYKLLVDGEFIVALCGELESLEDGSGWGYY